MTKNYNVEKIEVSYKPIDLSFEEITLLSENEYLENKKLITTLNDGWWLRSPGFNAYIAAFIRGKHGHVHKNGIYVFERFGVRPALRIRDYYNLIPRDKIRISGYIFTILNENLALCDICVGESIFDHETNDFENSVIRKYLYGWAKENNITFENS